MNRLQLMDQYGNLDTNQDGLINSDDRGYQTDTLYRPVGSESDSEQTNWMQEAYDENGHLLTGDWAGSVGDSNNAMDDLLNSNFNNGRVPDIGLVANIQPTREGEIIIENNTQQSSVKGIVEETPLSNLFFSKDNTDGIQKTLRYRVYQNTNVVIDYQSTQELFIIMRSILLQHANFKVSEEGLVNEILKLNQFVLDFAVEKVSSNVQQFLVYKDDVDYYPTPMDRPQYSGGSNNNTYDLSPHIGVERG
jgi:hypothetical protein